MESQEKIIKKTFSPDEMSLRSRLAELFEKCPIPKNELLFHLGLFTNRRTLSKMLFMNELYKMIIDVHGVVMEFGVRWGQNLALFESFRGIYEPYNHNRKIIGFDTFSGFPEFDKQDGGSDVLVPGCCSVTEGYEEYLKHVLDCHEQGSPIPHLKKYQLIKGDAVVEIEQYLKDNPETIIGLAYFDFDIYKPTKKCLEAVKNHLTKGSVIGFDELNDHSFPGETAALKEVFGLSRYKIRRNKYSSIQSYIVIE